MPETRDPPSCHAEEKPLNFLFPLYPTGIFFERVRSCDMLVATAKYPEDVLIYQVTLGNSGPESQSVSLHS